jgi:hypothetical protein
MLLTMCEWEGRSRFWYSLGSNWVGEVRRSDEFRVRRKKLVYSRQAAVGPRRPGGQASPSREAAKEYSPRRKPWGMSDQGNQVP